MSAIDLKNRLRVTCVRSVASPEISGNGDRKWRRWWWWRCRISKESIVK